MRIKITRFNLKLFANANQFSQLCHFFVINQFENNLSSSQNPTAKLIGLQAENKGIQHKNCTFTTSNYKLKKNNKLWEKDSLMYQLLSTSQ